MKHKNAVIATAIVLAVVLLVIVACQSPAPAPSAPVHVFLDNAYEVGASGDGPAGAAGDTNVTNIDASGSVNYGSANLYPVGNPADGKILAVGITTPVVQKATVVPTIYAISTVTAAGCAPDDAAFSGAWDCRWAMGSTNNITFTLYENDATPVPTAAYDQIRFWVAGN